MLLLRLLPLLLGMLLLRHRAPIVLAAIRSRRRAGAAAVADADGTTMVPTPPFDRSGLSIDEIILIINEVVGLIDRPPASWD